MLTEDTFNVSRLRLWSWIRWRNRGCSKKTDILEGATVLAKKATHAWNWLFAVALALSDKRLRPKITPKALI